MMIKLKDDSKAKLNNLHQKTNQNNLYEQKIKKIRKKILALEDDIDQINENYSKDQLNAIEKKLLNIFSDISYIEQIINNLKKNILEDNTNVDRLTNNYRDISLHYIQIQNKFVSKKLELTKQEMNNNIIESEQKVNELTQNMLFSIASIFLGISLTSAIVAGIELIPKELLILYFTTGGLIAITVLGIATVIIRNYDAKSKIVLKIFIIYTIIWSIIAGISYKTYNSSIEVEKEINVQINND